MEIRFHVTGAERKALVAVVSEIVGWEAVYKKAPTFAYVVNNYTIDKNGTLIFDEQADVDEVRSLSAGLAERGFISEDAPAVDTFTQDAPVGDALAEDAPVNDTPSRLSIEMPLDGFTETALQNLEKLVASKASLIRKAVGTDTLSVVSEGDRLCFPWFTLGASPGEVTAYTQFVAALCDMAKKQKRVTATEKPADSEKFAFRCFLLRLGFIGHEYAAARKLLLANLPGDGSFKSGKRREPDEGAPLAAHDADSGAEAVDTAAVTEDEPAVDSAAYSGEVAAYA